MNSKALAAAAVAASCFLLYNISAKAAPPASVSAKSAVVIEQGSHRVLYEKNVHERLPMASTTKIMTALVATRHGNLKDVVKIPDEAVGVRGSSIYLRKGEELSLEQLLYGLMLQSGNDAAVAIAIHVGGSVDGFLAMMNEEASALGLKDSHFASPNGLDTPGHYTSAYDLAIIASTAMENADFRRIISTKTTAIPYEGAENGRQLRNTNRILWSYEGANGVKTGYTGKAGRCFVGAANREGMQVVSVVLNSGSIFEESARIMDQAFAQYDMVPVAEPRMALGAVSTKEGVAGSVRYGSSKKLTLPLTEEERRRVLVTLGVASKLNAPVADGQPVGLGRVTLDGQELGEFPVVALEADGRKTFAWYIKKAVEGFLWRKNGEGSGYRSIWPLAG